MYKVKVNAKHDFNIDFTSNGVMVNDAVVELDELVLNSHTKHVLFQDKSYTLELVQLNRDEKSAEIKVNGNLYSVNVQDQFDQLLKQLGLDNLASNKVQHIKAPMPGLVLQILASENMEVKKGDNLLVLEAMKMENMLKSPTDGIIQKILIKAGDKVEKNQILIQF